MYEIKVKLFFIIYSYSLKSLLPSSKQCSKGFHPPLFRIGSFIIKHHAEKIARNISENTTMIIPAHNTPAFKPAKEFLKEMK